MRANRRRPRPLLGTGSFFISGFFLLTTLLLRSPGESALTISQPVAGMDDIPPAPAGQIQAIDRPDDTGGHILITWTLSPDDRVLFTSLPPDGDLSAPGTVVRTNEVTGYRLYRRSQDAPFAFVGEVESGVGSYLDAQVKNGVLYAYDVRAFDSAHEVPPQILPGSPADLARTARPFDDTARPLDASGHVVLGWFNPEDDSVGFDDFFLFADHFGRIDGELGFDPLFDLNDDQRVDFDDFFLFSDFFGRKVANYDEIVGGTAN